MLSDRVHLLSAPTESAGHRGVPADPDARHDLPAPGPRHLRPPRRPVPLAHLARPAVSAAARGGRGLTFPARGRDRLRHRPRLLPPATGPLDPERAPPGPAAP